MAIPPKLIPCYGSLLYVIVLSHITTPTSGTSCYLPEFKSPLQGLTFKSAKGYPRRNISEEVNLNTEIRPEIKTLGRILAHERQLTGLFPEEAYIEYPDIPHTVQTCPINRKYFAIGDVLVDKDLGDCWVLWQWRGMTITWAECDRYCKEVTPSPPYFVFLCIPGHVVKFSFWAFCPLHRRFLKKTIELPQCCNCSKYTCLIQPRVIKVGSYHDQLFSHPTY